MNPYAAACFALSAGLKVAVALSLLFASGCGPQGPLASVKPGIGFAGRVAVVDADLQAVRNFQPVLPDDLGKPGGCAPPKPPEVEKPKAPEQTLLIFTNRFCGPCVQQINAAVNPLKKAGRIVKNYGEEGAANIWIVDFDRHGETVKKYAKANAQGAYPLPQWALVVDGKVVRSGIGITPAAASGAMKKWQAAQAEPETLKWVSVVLQHKPLRDSQRNRNRDYDWPGDLRKHLTESPHSLSRATVESWTDRQCIDWHNRWHETHGER